MTAKKLISLIMALTMLLGVFVILPSCASDDEAETGSDDLTVSTTELVENEGLPENQKLGFDENAINFDNAEITILQRTSHKDEIGGDQSSNIVDVGVYARNIYVQDKLGVKFNFVDEVCVMGVNSNTEAFFSRIDVSALTGSAELDAVACPAVSFVSDIVSNYYVNLYDVPNIDLSKAWYNPSFTASSELAGKVYGIAGDMTISMVDHLEVMFMNIELAETYFPNVDFYELVANGEWTYDNMLNYLKEVGDQGDSGNGMATLVLAYNANSIDGFLMGLGINLVSRDANGRPYMTMDIEKNYNIADMLKTLYHETPGVYRAGSNSSNWDFLYGRSFASGKAMFEVFRLNTTEEYYIDSEVEYGILPIPKLNEEQDNYFSVPQGEYSCIGIFDSISDERKEVVGTTLEYMGHYNYHKIRPLLYETLYKYRYLSDEYAAEVFDIVIDSVSFDFSYIYAEIIGSPINCFRDYIWQDGDDLASKVASKKTASTKKLNSLLKYFYED